MERPAQTMFQINNEEIFGSLKTTHFEKVVRQLAEICDVQVYEKKSFTLCSSLLSVVHHDQRRHGEHSSSGYCWISQLARERQ